MGLKGKKLNSDVVMFGEPISEKALRALEGRSPTGNDIIKSLPPTAFMPKPKPSNAEILANEKLKEENYKKELVISAKEAKRERLRKKKLAAAKKREAEIINKEVAPPTKVEEPVVEVSNTIIQRMIDEPTIFKESKSMNLEEELKALENDMKPKEVVPPTPREVDPVVENPVTDMKDQILELLENEENAPSIDHINAWKEAYGKNGIHVMAFGEGEVYIYHHLTRGEWKKIKELMNKMKESQNAEEVEEKLKEKVVLYCTLWPSVDEKWLEYCKAGILDSLYQMILLNSGFLTPQQAMLLTTQL